MVLAFDGRIDNRDDVVAALGLPPRDLPESSIVLAAVERWGEAAPHRLIGDFAYAVWDSRARRLILTVDQGGCRTLYFHAADGAVAFATSMGTLLALPGVPRRLDEGLLAEHLIQCHRNDDRTEWQGIQRIPAGSQGVFGDGSHRVEAWWRFDPARRIRLARDQDYVDAARDLLDQAVACRLRSATPIVASLSGGLDSSAVVATAVNRFAPQGLDTLTITPPHDAPPMPWEGRYHDERPFVEAIGRRYPNLRLHFAHSDAEQRGVSESVEFLERNALMVHWGFSKEGDGPILELMRSLGSTVHLGGMAGNHLLSWDGIAGLGGMLDDGRYLAFAGEVRALAAVTGRSLLRTAWGGGVRQRSPRFLRRGVDWLKGRPATPYFAYSIANPVFLADVNVMERLGDQPILPGFDSRFDSRALRMRAMETRFRLLERARSRGRTIGIEVRSPLADTRLLEFCLAIPDDQYLRNGTTRWLARRVLADRLPAEVVSNPLRGAQDQHWFRRMTLRRAEFVERVEAMAASPLANRVLDIPRIRKLIQEWPADAAAANRRWYDFHTLLPHAVNVGSFLRWAESRSR